MPAFMFAVGYTVMFALPEEMFKDVISSTSLVSEETFERKIKNIERSKFTQFWFIQLTYTNMTENQQSN